MIFAEYQLLIMHALMYHIILCSDLFDVPVLYYVRMWNYTFKIMNKAIFNVTNKQSKARYVYRGKMFMAIHI
jgi:hypothetical protein